jgi:hypothetical protein
VSKCGPADPDGNDRLAERDQDDQPMPVGEVLGSDPPATAHADHDRAEVVDGKCDHPHRDARVALEEASRHEQRDSEDRGWGEPK